MNSCKMRTHRPMKQIRIHTSCKQRMSFNFCFEKNFHKLLFQESSRLVTFNCSYYFVVRYIAAFFVNILKFPRFIMSLSTAGLTRCPAETGFLCDETDAITGTPKWTRSAQDVHYVPLCWTLYSLHLTCSVRFLCFAQFRPYILILYPRKLTDWTL
jgi:hypothetical protein